MASLRMVMTLYLISLLSFQVHSQTTCKSMVFSNKKTFASCMDLPVLETILHWTYDAPKSTLSMAFTAPSNDGGWVAWGLNPSGTGMIGSQVLMAYKQKPSESRAVETVDIMSYHSVDTSPISYNVTDLSVEDSSGKVTIFCNWLIPNGQTTVNTVWQVGPVEDGKPEVHAMDPANMGSKKSLDLANVAVSSPSIEPTQAPMWTVDVAREKNGAIGVVVSIFSVLGALLVSLF